MRSGLGSRGAAATDPHARLPVRGALVVAAAVAVSALSVLFAPSDPRAGAGGPGNAPNIIVLMTDDQTLESLQVMPQVQQRLGDKGVTFSTAVVSNPRCCPSRATFLTGQYSHNNQVFTNRRPDGGYRNFVNQETTLPAALQEGGYRTVHIGKYLNGYGAGKAGPTEIPPGWTTWRTSPSKDTYAYWGFALNENGTLRAYSHDDRDYHTDVMRRLAVKAIRKEARKAGPFFLTVSFLAPHGGDNPRLPPVGKDEPRFAWPAPRHAGRFANEPLPKPPSFDEADVSDKPGFVQSKPRLTKQVKREIRARYRLRLEALLAVDGAVKKVMRALGDTGARRDTVVIFASDNGYFQGEHRFRAGKVFPYEPAIRVPLVIRGPGIPEGTQTDALVSNVDLGPTILDLAGVAPLREPDGRSLVPLLEDPGAAWDGEVLIESGGPSDTLVGRGVRDGQWKYVEWRNGETQAVEAAELYDLQADPDELDNRAGDSAYAGQVAAMADRLAALVDCTAASCRP